MKFFDVRQDVLNIEQKSGIIKHNVGRVVKKEPKICWNDDAKPLLSSPITLW